MKKTKKKTKKIKPSSKKKTVSSSKNKTKKKRAAKKQVKKKPLPKKKINAKKVAKKKSIIKKKPLVKTQTTKLALKKAVPVQAKAESKNERMTISLSEISMIDEKIIVPQVEEGEETIEDMTTMEDGYGGFDDSVSSDHDDDDEN